MAGVELLGGVCCWEDWDGDVGNVVCFLFFMFGGVFGGARVAADRCCVSCVSCIGWASMWSCCIGVT